MSNVNNLYPLPFYDSLDKQNARKSYAYGAIYPLFAHKQYLLPFQLVGYSADDITEIMVHYTDGTELSIAEEAGNMVNVTLTDGTTVAVWTATTEITIDTLLIGQCWLEITFSDGTVLYSEVMTLVNDISPYLKIEWWDDSDLVTDNGTIAYNGTYHNFLYFNSELGKPEYEFEEEGEDRDGYFFAEKQVSYKRYKAQFMAAEFVCDALRIAQLSDYRRITDKYGNILAADTFLITPEWQEQGDLASVTAEVTTNTVAKKTASWYTQMSGRSFNDSYNKSYQ